MRDAGAVHDPVAAFIAAACVTREADGSDSHASGTLERAESILQAHLEVARASIHAAAILADDVVVRRFLEADAANATANRGGRPGVT